MEAIRERGGNPFLEYQLQNAIIKLKQGFGRIIRTHTDEGMVVVLDPRIHTKAYGKQFIASLPPCRVITESAARVSRGERRVPPSDLAWNEPDATPEPRQPRQDP